jgi:hypothetical protein
VTILCGVELLDRQSLVHGFVALFLQLKNCFIGIFFFIIHFQDSLLLLNNLIVLVLSLSLYLNAYFFCWTPNFESYHVGCPMVCDEKFRLSNLNVQYAEVSHVHERNIN